MSLESHGDRDIKITSHYGFSSRGILQFKNHTFTDVGEIRVKGKKKDKVRLNYWLFYFLIILILYFLINRTETFRIVVAYWAIKPKFLVVQVLALPPSF